MRVSGARGARIAVVALPLISACSGAGRQDPAVPQPPPSSAASADSIDYDAIYRARQDSARMRFTEADAEFVAGMIAHHAQALVMSEMAPTHGASPAIRTLTARIINAQRDEIAIMQRWLRLRDQPVPQIHIEGTVLTIHGSEHAGHMMPGMLTPEQIDALDAARGEAFDRLFLEYMIQHHQGAVTMVLDLLKVDGALQDEAVFKLASDIQVDQTTEIARMEKMLAQIPAGGRSR
jgi:uncharacterized protein (DUF305 family)